MCVGETLLKFDTIRSGVDGQRGSFEELVCQLLRRHPPVDAAEYRRIHGSGGDGGIESYWSLTSGKKIGYQAKYFTKVASIDWAQLDKSFKRAIDLYPDLQEYVFALPCNLTGKKSRDPTINFGWKSWDKYKSAWETYSKKKLGRTIEISLRTASDIEDLLEHPNSVGLKAYWFEEVEFSAAWFTRHVHEAISALDERYHPEDHVHVRSQRFLEIFRRSPRIFAEIRTLLEKFDRSHRIPMSRLGDVLPKNLLGPFVEAQAKLKSVQEDLNKPIWANVGISVIASLLQEYGFLFANGMPSLGEMKELREGDQRAYAGWKGGSSTRSLGSMTISIVQSKLLQKHLAPPQRRSRLVGPP